MALTTTTDSTATTIEPPMFGSWGFGNELVLYAAMRDRGIEPEVDAEIIQQPFDMSLLLNREIDAAQGKSYNEYAMLLEATNPDTGELYQPEDFNVIDLGVEGYLTLEDAIYARGGWLDDPANADIAARFVAASMEGWIYCSDEFDACVDIVLDNGSTRFYFDGELLMEGVAGALASVGMETEIGHAGDGGFVGIIDEAAIYGIALSDDQVMANFETPGLAVDPVGKLATEWASLKGLR